MVVRKRGGKRGAPLTISAGPRVRSTMQNHKNHGRRPYVSSGNSRGKISPRADESEREEEKRRTRGRPVRSHFKKRGGGCCSWWQHTRKTHPIAKLLCCGQRGNREEPDLSAKKERKRPLGQISLRERNGGPGPSTVLSTTHPTFNNQRDLRPQLNLAERRRQGGGGNMFCDGFLRLKRRLKTCSAGREHYVWTGRDRRNGRAGRHGPMSVAGKPTQPPVP